MKIVKTTLFAFALIALTMSALTSASAQEKAQVKEVRVTMKDLPAPVQQTVKEQSKGAVLRGLAKEIENGQTFYEVELNVAGHSKDVLIAADGKVVEVEEQVALNSLPPIVKSEIIKQAGKGKILLVESVTKDNTLVAYEAHVRTAGKLSEIKVGLDGKPIVQ